MNQYNRWSEWRKWDLHFHTPSSYDYKDKSVTNEDIINKLIEKNISVVAITDHHIIDNQRIAELQKLWKKNNITVFPWIEFLSDARWSDPIHFIAIFWEDSNIEYIWWQLENKTSINKIKWSLKKENEVYCDLEDTISLVHELWWIVTIHSWQKHWSVECITNSLPHAMAQKTDIAEYVDIYELWNIKDQEWYKSVVFPKIWKTLPMIICSDNHNINKYEIKENLWIKADPTFEWLKQIIYEPDERVFIGPNKPEEKTGYQIIDRIEINEETIENKEIVFNQNLNTIIWWRSTWKSVLLAAIAKKLNLEDKPKFEENYGKYIDSISNNIKIFWKDWEENYEREVEYFEQSYMYDLSREVHRSKLNKIIEKILKQKWKDIDMNSYYEFISDNKKTILSQVSDLFQILWDISKVKQLILDIWDKEWVKKEIKKLEDELKKNTTIDITEEEKISYEWQKKSFEDLKNNKEKNNNDITNLEKLKQQVFIKETIDYELVWISNNYRKQEISLFYDEIKKEFKDKWTKRIEEIKTKVESENRDIDKKIKKIEEDYTYKKVSKAFAESVQLKQIESKIRIQKIKLSQIEEHSKKLTSLEEQRNKLIEDLKSEYKKFSAEAKKIIKKLSDKVDWLEIKAEIRVREKEYKEILESSLNNKVNDNKDALSKDSKDIFNIFDDLIKWKLKFTVWNNAESLTKRIMTEDLNEIHYELIYEKDTFWQMSDGKKAFVVLKLLLDFSDKECPILIDQPEDDLDNRSICSELVEYLKKKKKQRQIIVATHNPNVVVTADAEEIIVANQNGKWVPNKNWKKFQYISWSLEYHKPIDKSILKTSILDSQWINEHVCDIVEWWEIAFEQRKKKYNF